MLLRAALAALLLLVAAGCGGGGTETSTTSLAPGCEVPRIQAIVNRFFAAVTTNDPAELARLVPPSPRYLVHDGVGADERRVELTSRGGVLRYFAARERHRERDRLISLRVAPGLDANHVLVDARLTRTATDFPRRGITTRLGAATARINCVTRRIERLLIQGP